MKLLCSKKILTKPVGYQQPTCFCVRMEFVVGTISLYVNCFHFRAAVFVHVCPTQLCTESSV